MNLDSLRNRIKLHEGYSAQPYLDSVGVLTIGFGHNIEYITRRSRHEKWLEADIQRSVSEAREWLPVWDDLSDTRQEVVVELFFQLGGPKARQFKRFKAALIADDMYEAVVELRTSRWFEQVPTRAKEMIKLFEHG